MNVVFFVGWWFRKVNTKRLYIDHTYILYMRSVIETIVSPGRCHVSKKPYVG